MTKYSSAVHGMLCVSGTCLPAKIRNWWSRTQEVEGNCSRKTIHMDGIDPDLLQRCDEVSRWRRTCDYGSDWSWQPLCSRMVDESDLLKNTERRGGSQIS